MRRATFNLGLGTMLTAEEDQQGGICGVAETFNADHVPVKKQLSAFRWKLTICKTMFIVLLFCVILAGKSSRPILGEGYCISFVCLTQALAGSRPVIRHSSNVTCNIGNARDIGVGA